MKVIVASDHVGLPLKQAVAAHLQARGLEVADAGPTTTAMVDYPDYAQLVGRAVAAGQYEQGVLVCGTGLGMSIAANKVSGIRAALCHETYTAHMGRAHNDANVLCLGAWVVSPQRVVGILDEWFRTEFEGGRHEARIAKLEIGADATSGPRLRPSRLALATSPRPTTFAPVLYAGRLDEAASAAAEAGFTAIELSLCAPDDVNPDTLRGLLDRHGLGLSAIATGQACLLDGLCLASPEPERRSGALARLKAHVEMASGYGAPVIVGGIRGRLTGTPAEEAEQRARAVEALREVVRHAASRGVTLLLEPINRYETNFVNTLSEGLALIDEIGEPGLRLLADTFHMNIEEADVPAALRDAAGCLGYIHFADSNRHAPGRGHLDFPAIAAALGGIGYGGPVAVEILPLPDDEAATRQAGTFIRALLSA